MMNNFFEYEKVQSLKGEVKVLDVEKELSTTIIINSKKIELGGKLDRIEVFNDAFRIIDYKSGSVSHLELQFKSWNDLRKKTKSKAFQLMMYAYLFSKVRKVDAVSAGNYAFRNNNSGTVYVKPIEDNIILQKDHFLKVETIIIEIINEILDSKIPFVQVKQKVIVLFVIIRKYVRDKKTHSCEWVKQPIGESNSCFQDENLAS